MKKIYSLIAAALISTAAFSQVTLTLMLDVNAYVAAGNTINAAGVHLAGQFMTNGCTEITSDWNPADAGGGLTDMGAGIWGITLTFSAEPDDSLQFKFINGNDWAVGGPNIEGQSGTTLLSDACGFGDGFGGYNRLFVFSDETEEGYQFCWDMCTRCDGSDPEIVGIFNQVPVSTNISVYPNPATSTATVGFNVALPGEVTFEVYNITGQLVKSFTSSFAVSGNNEYALDLSGIENGMYNLIIRSGDAIATKSIVKN